MVIRNTTLNDAPQLLSLMEQLGYPQTIPDMKDRLQQYMSSDSQVLIAENQGLIMGLIAFFCFPLFVSSGKSCRIAALVVDETCRGQGVGRDLLKAAEERAKQQGCVILDLTSGLRRAKDGSHEFYKNLGYGNDGPQAKLYFRKVLM